MLWIILLTIQLLSVQGNGEARALGAHLAPNPQATSTCPKGQVALPLDNPIPVPTATPGGTKPPTVPPLCA